MCCNQSLGVQYVLNIAGQSILLAIDVDLERQFSAFFRQFFPDNRREPVSETPCIWIGRTERTDLPTGVRQVVCRTDSESWPFELLTTLEDHLLQIVRQTALHGAALARGDRTLLLLGERKSGKSTLTHYLTLHGWCLVDDDCCFYAQGILAGTGFPLRLRRCQYPESDIFWQCVDADGEERRFILPKQRIMQSSAPFFSDFSTLRTECRIPYRKNRQTSPVFTSDSQCPVYPVRTSQNPRSFGFHSPDGVSLSCHLFSM